MLTEIDNSGRQRYGKWYAKSESNTHDRVFLLSYTEANRYLDVPVDNWNNLKSRAAPTAYAIAHGALTGSYRTKDGITSGWWWLRTPGCDQHDAGSVNDDGSLSSVDVSLVCVIARPALWISLESDNFLSDLYHAQIDAFSMTRGRMI